jgi:hypothetical protein
MDGENIFSSTFLFLYPDLRPTPWPFLFLFPIFDCWLAARPEESIVCSVFFLIQQGTPRFFFFDSSSFCWFQCGVAGAQGIRCLLSFSKAPPLYFLSFSFFTFLPTLRHSASEERRTRS